MTRTHWLLLALPLLASLVVGLVHHGEHHTWYERIPGFFVVFGFLGCVLIIVFSKLLGKLWLQVDEDYYDDPGGPDA